MADAPEKIWYCPECKEVSANCSSNHNIDLGCGKIRQHGYFVNSEYIHVDKAYSYDEGYGKGYNFGKEVATKNIRAVLKENPNMPVEQYIRSQLYYKFLEAMEADINEK